MRGKRDESNTIGGRCREREERFSIADGTQNTIRASSTSPKML